MITPLDIENKKFSKQMMNGYSVEEVDDFLDELTVDYSKNYKEATELKTKVEELTKRSRRDLLKIRYLGKSSFNEIERELESYGLKLKETKQWKKNIEN